MSQRVIVNVATDSWVAGQQRLCGLALALGGQEVRLWTNSFPPGCPPHRVSGSLAGLHDQCRPYAFKAYALQQAAAEGVTSLIWCDASVIPIRPLEPLWEHIEREGYWISKNGWDNSDWTADSAYPDLFPGMELEQARTVNRTIPHVVGTAFGLDLTKAPARLFLHEYYRLASQTRAFCGPWQNTEAVRVAGRNVERWAAPCGPATTLGHRHDQTAMAVIAWRLKMQLTDGPHLFAYALRDDQNRAKTAPADYPEDTYLVAVGP